MCDHEVQDHMDEDFKGMLSRRQLVQGLAAGTAAVVATGATGCATNPETGKKQLIMVSESQLNSMAASSWAEAKQKQKLSTDPRYTSRLKNIGARISQGAGRSEQNWEYAVFDDDAKNAFVLPGNRVGFYKGMMDFADNDSQIAAVMGHEVGHVSGRHAAERVSQQMLGGAAVQIGGAVGSAKLMERCRKMDAAYRASNGGLTRAEANAIQKCVAGTQQQSQMLSAALGAGLMYGVILRYSRQHELEADLLGAKYMHKAGYDVMQSVQLWEKMAEANTNRQPEWMSTHPNPSTRAVKLREYIKANGWA